MVESARFLLHQLLASPASNDARWSRRVSWVFWLQILPFARYLFSEQRSHPADLPPESAHC